MSNLQKKLKEYQNIKQRKEWLTYLLQCRNNFDVEETYKEIVKNEQLKEDHNRVIREYSTTLLDTKLSTQKIPTEKWEQIKKIITDNSKKE